MRMDTLRSVGGSAVGRVPVWDRVPAAFVFPIRLLRSRTWLAAGLIVLLAFLAVLGPGLSPLEEDPRLS